ncbi:hypothetical protein G7Y89_g11143 [Neofusicoccum parvum]|nr:hypothetical protein G7Y89_g11143 [Neofusicoccum parvum]
METLVRSLISQHQGGRSAKLSDPLQFTREPEKEPSFRHWKAEMYNKLEVNADHYKTERAKISYIFSRTTGTASDTIRPNAVTIANAELDSGSAKNSGKE